MSFTYDDEGLRTSKTVNGLTTEYFWYGTRLVAEKNANERILYIYDANTCRFINADGYVSTGQGLLGYNMFAYCNNNPVNCVDYGGSACTKISFGFDFLDDIERVMGGSGSGGLALGLLVAATLTTAVALNTTGKSLAKSSAPPIPAYKVLAEEKETIGQHHTNIYIYRYGGVNPSNLTPSKRDVVLFETTGMGLSFSLTPRIGAAVTTIEEINATGILVATIDGLNHVSVFPNGATLEDWHNAGKIRYGRKR